MLITCIWRITLQNSIPREHFVRQPRGAVEIQAP